MNKYIPYDAGINPEAKNDIYPGDLRKVQYII
jgi:hypothetical protein